MIRTATSADIPAMLVMLKQHHAEHDFNWPFDPALLSMALAGAVAAPDNLVLIDNGAMLWARYFDCDLGSGRHATERVIRATKRGQYRQLRTAYEEWARANGCKDAALSCVRWFELFRRLYRRDGYLLAEAVHVKPLT